VHLAVKYDKNLTARNAMEYAGKRKENIANFAKLAVKSISDGIKQNIKVFLT